MYRHKISLAKSQRGDAFRRSIVGVGIALCILIVSIAAGARLKARVHAQSPNVIADRFKPLGLKAFTVEIADAAASTVNGTIGKTTVYAFKSEGSSYEGPWDLASGQTRIVTDVPARLRIRIDDRNRYKTTMPFKLRPNTVSPRLPRDERCAFPSRPGWEPAYIGEDTILGYKTYKYRHREIEVPDREQTIHTFTWYAPDLTCFELQQHAEKRDRAGNVVATFDKIPKRISIGEPDPALFRIDSSYKEVPPSEFERAGFASAGASAEYIAKRAEKERQRLDGEDRRYRQAQALR
jgi:hypothetical protein